MSKKDYNYIASMEKSISDKYGKQAVQDFRNTWEPEKENEYLQQLQEQRKGKTTTSTTKYTVGDILISKRRSEKNRDRSCPVCKTYSFSTRDDLYMNRFKCCFRCYIDFVEGTEEKWKTGWRPNEEQLATALGRRK
jgi:hypothetical protein